MNQINSNGDDKNAINNENDWDNLYDESGKCLSEELEKLNLGKNVSNEQNQESLKKNNKKIDYFKLEAKKEETQNEEDWESPKYAHIIEIYDFPTSFKNEDIMNAFKDGKGNQNLCLKWVDDTHCLGIFSSESEASKALKLDNALIKARPVSQASSESKKLAKRKLDFLKPYKPRPQTSSLVASKLIGASLGISNMLSKDKLNIERDKIKQAKDKRLKEKDLKESIWNGEA